MAIARVQGASNNSGSDATSLVLTFGSPVGSGNFVIGALTWYPLTTNITSIVDNQSNTYTTIHNFNDATDEQRIFMFARKNITNAPTTITINFSANASFRAGVIDEFSGVEGTTVNFNGQMQSAPGTGTDAITSGNITSGTTGDLVWGATFGTGGAGTAPNVGTGFTVGTTNTPTVVARSEFRELPSAATTAATYTQGSAALWSTIAGVFDGGAAGSPYTLTAETGTVALAGQAANLVYGPWTLVGVGTITSGNATTIAPTVPAGAAQNDLLVAFISSRIASTTSITLPTGGEWTLVTEQKSNNVLTTGSAAASGLMAYCIRGASNPNTTFTFPTAPSIAMATINVYRGVNTSSPLDTQNSTTTAISTTSVSVAGVTTAGAGELLVVGLCGGQEAAWSAVDATNPSVASGATNTTTHPTYNTWLERSDALTTTGADTSLATADAVKSAAGATGNITATASVAASHVVLIGAFKPPVVSGSPYTMAAAPSAFTLTGGAVVLKTALPAGTGVFALAGQAVAVRTVRRMAAATGAFAVAGQPAVLRSVRKMVAGTGAFAVAGQAVIPRVTLPAGVGTFTVAGQSAALRSVRKIVAGTGAFSVAGQTVNLVAPFGKTLAATTGAFALSGQPVALRSTRKLSATFGTVTLTGQPVTLQRTFVGQTLSAETGTFTLTGQPVDLFWTASIDYVMEAVTGEVLLTGQTVNLVAPFGRTLPAATGVFATAGQPIALRISRKVAAGTGAIVLSGKAAVLRAIRKMVAGTGTVTVSGQPVALTKTGSYALMANRGQFTLAGQPVTLRYPRRMVAGVGAFAVAGQPAVLRSARKVSVVPGSFLLEGQPINLVVHVTGYTMPVARGTFVLTGNVVELNVVRVSAPPLLEAQPGRLTFGRRVSIRRW